MALRPGRERVAVTAYVAVPDERGRLRFLIPAEGPTLARIARAGGPEASGPFRSWRSAGDGTVGEFWAVPPARHRAYWLERATELRGQLAVVEVAPRRFAFHREGPEARGVAFDLVAFDPADPAPPGGERGDN